MMGNCIGGVLADKPLFDRFQHLRRRRINKLLFRLPSSLSKQAGLSVLVEVAGAESTKDSSKNRDRVAAKLSKPNLDVLLSNSSVTPGLLRGEFSYNGKLVSFSKKSETRKAEADTGVEEDVLNVPSVCLNSVFAFTVKIVARRNFAGPSF